MLIPGNRVKMGCSVIKNLVAETGLLSKYTPMQLRTRFEYWRKGLGKPQEKVFFKSTNAHCLSFRTKILVAGL